HYSGALFFDDPTTTVIYTLSLHDALPILSRRVRRVGEHGPPMEVVSNVLTLEIRPAPEAWVKAQIDSAVKVLDAPIKPRANAARDRKSTRLNSSHVSISYAVFCLKKKKTA